MQDFGVSILSGVVTTFLIWLFIKVLSPMYKGWRYSAPKIEGDWLFHDKGIDSPSVGNAKVYRSGESVKAAVTRTTSRSGKAISRSFQYKGTVRDGQLLLKFTEPVSGGFISGNLVLKVSGDIKNLSGYTVYLDRDSGKVECHPIDFTKK